MSKKKPVCDVCGNEYSLVADTGLCGACCFGEASLLEPASSHIGDYQVITLKEMDAVLKTEKGWTRYSNQGREYVYEFCVPNSDIRIRVQSSIDIKSGKNELPAFDCIRMYAILYTPARSGNPKTVRGLCKAARTSTAKGWEERVKLMYPDVLRRAKAQLRPHRPFYRDKYAK